MAFVAPIAGALFGGLLTGWAGWGLSVGWLVGSWLFGPKAEQDNQVFDPGAEELPTFNQALRGSTLPILFGTNRVANQVVWQKNFTTIRHESKQGGGGGKFGGSGMGAKGGGPETTNVTYEYKWDLMFHLGMSDTDFTLFGGWLVAERLNDATILAISNESSGLSGIFGQSTDRPNNAELNFESGFFHGCDATGSAAATNWSNFETEEGGPYRWPYTAYIGFKQLNLGGSAHVPQLSFEIGPGEATVTTNNNIFSATDQLGTDGTAHFWPFKGQDGKIYAMHDGAGDSAVFSIYSLETESVIHEPTVADIQADITALGYDGYWNGFWDLAANYALESCNMIHTTDEGSFCVVRMQALGTVTTTYTIMILYRINSSGSVERCGHFAHVSTTLRYAVCGGDELHITGDHSSTNPLLLYAYGAVSATHYIVFGRMPSISEMLGTGLEEAAAAFDTRLTNLQDVLTVDNPPTQYAFANQTFVGTGNDAVRGIRVNDYGWVQPYATIGLGITWTNRYYWPMSYAFLKWVEDTYGARTATEKGIYDDYGYPYPGLCAYIDFTDSGSGGWTFLSDGLEVETSPFVDTAGNDFTWPYDGYDQDGVTRDTKSCYGGGNKPLRITAGAGAGGFLLCTFTYMHTSNDWQGYFGSKNTYTRANIFIYNPLTKQYINYGSLETSAGQKDELAANPIPDKYALTNAYGHKNSFVYYWWDSTNTTLYCGHSITTVAGGDDNAGIFSGATINITGGSDVTPAFIIYKILTSSVYGIGFSESDIDSTSYGLAVQYCESEDIKVSVQYRREESALAIIDQLLTLYGGFLTEKGGKVYFGLQEFTANPIRTIDNDRLVIDGEGEAPVKVTKGARQDTYNRVKVNYFDRGLEYRQNFIELADEVDMDINGVRAQEYPAKFVMSEATALKIATRALWGNLYARDIYDFKLGPKDADLEPGDVVTLVDSHNINLRGGKQVRIVEWQETQPLRFSVKAVDEIEYINTSTTGASSLTEVGSNILFGPSQPPADFQMYELPKEFQGADARLFVGYRQQSAAMGARLYVSADGVSFTQTDDAQPFIISGILKAGLPSRDPGYVEENIEVYLMPDTRSGEFTPATPTYCQTFALEDASANARALSAAAIFVNSEMLAYEGVNLVAQNHYRFDKVYRGWGGTPIQAHASGDTWWRHAGGVFTQILNADKVGNIFHYKVQPYNFAGVGYNISSIDAKTYQIQGTFWRPQNQGALRTYVQSPGSYLTIQSEDLKFITKKKVLTGGSPVQIEWPDASRDSGYGALGYDYLTYGGFDADTTSHSYRVQVYSSDGTTVVRCTTVSTLAFLYTVDNNSTDFNGWSGSFRVKVTPYNTLGDALRSRTKILELFE